MRETEAQIGNSGCGVHRVFEQTPRAGAASRCLRYFPNQSSAQRFPEFEEGA